MPMLVTVICLAVVLANAATMARLRAEVREALENQTICTPAPRPGVEKQT